MREKLRVVVFAAAAAVALLASSAADNSASRASMPLDQVEGAGFWRDAACWTCIGFGAGVSVVIPPQIIWNQCASVCAATF